MAMSHGSYLELFEVSRPPTHRNDVQARYESEVPESSQQSNQVGDFEFAGNERVAQANPVLQPQGETATPKRPIKARARKTGEELVPPLSLPWRDGDSGYGGSPEIYGESIPQRPGALLFRPAKKTSSDKPLSVPNVHNQISLAKRPPGLKRERRRRPLVIIREVPDQTESITLCNETSTSQPHFLPQTLKASRLWPALSASADAMPAGHPRKTWRIASTKRKDPQEEFYPEKLAGTAPINGEQSEPFLTKTTEKEELIHNSTPIDIGKKPSTSLCCPSDEGSDTQDTARIGVLQWVDATKDASTYPPFTPPAIPSASISNRSSPAAPVQALSLREGPVSSSRALVLEFWSILQERDQYYDAYESLQTHESTEWYTDDIHSLRTSTNGSGSSGSPKSSATSNSTPIGPASKNALSTNKRSREGEGDEDEHSNRRPIREQGVCVPDALLDSNYPGQMSCPMHELHDCQGTNTTISELMRSLMNRHRVVICKECCTRLPIPDEEKRPVNILQKHASDGCERYCIGTSCANTFDDSTHFHRRTERCPSWATLTKEARWTFIWRLVNPESNPPEPNFLPGPAFEHSQIRRPCKQQARARGSEICAQLMRDIEAKERRISTLENDLITAKNENMQTQQRCNEKTVNLENIIESLLERLCENGIGLPGSLRKRLQNECPEVIPAILVKESQTVSTLPTSALTPNDRYYPASSVSSTWGNMNCPPPTIPTIPVTWGAAPQQMVAPNSGYYLAESTEKAPTTRETRLNNVFRPFMPDWYSMSMSPGTIHAHVERYSSSETPETVQPCE